jgi:hypothetical protein
VRGARPLAQRKFIPEAAHRIQPGLLGRHSRIHVVFRAHFDVGTEFVLEVLIQLAGAENENQATE